MNTLETIGLVCESIAYLILLPALVVIPWFI